MFCVICGPFQYRPINGGILLTLFNISQTFVDLRWLLVSSHKQFKRFYNYNFRVVWILLPFFNTGLDMSPENDWKCMLILKPLKLSTVTLSLRELVTKWGKSLETKYQILQTGKKRQNIRETVETFFPLQCSFSNLPEKTYVTYVLSKDNTQVWLKNRANLLYCKASWLMTQRP